MTKNVVWVELTVKKNNVDEKLLHLKYVICQKLWQGFQ